MGILRAVIVLAVGLFLYKCIEAIYDTWTMLKKK